MKNEFAYVSGALMVASILGCIGPDDFSLFPEAGVQWGQSVEGKPLALGARFEVGVYASSSREDADEDDMEFVEARSAEGRVTPVIVSDESLELSMIEEGTDSIELLFRDRVSGETRSRTLEVEVKRPTQTELTFGCVQSETPEHALFLVGAKDVVVNHVLRADDGDGIDARGYDPYSLFESDGLTRTSFSGAQAGGHALFELGTQPGEYVLRPDDGTQTLTFELVEVGQIDGFGRVESDVESDTSSLFESEVGGAFLIAVAPTVGGEELCGVELELTTNVLTPETCARNTDLDGSFIDPVKGVVMFDALAAGECEVEFVDATTGMSVTVSETIAPDPYAEVEQ